MARDQIQLYLRALKCRLWLRGLFDAELLAEVEDHLLESMEAGLRRGLSEQEAEKQAVERFGSVIAITSAVEAERKSTMQTLLLLVSALIGLFSAYVDSRPTWDDTGILAFSILIVSGLIALLGYRRPWLSALAIGVWIPLHGILITHNHGSILALAFAFAGAYGGWLLRLGIQKTFHPA
jgi:hypothetical protein